MKVVRNNGFYGEEERGEELKLRLIKKGVGEVGVTGERLHFVYFCYP